MRAVRENKGKNWKLIAQNVEGKTEVQCLHRWTKVLNPSLQKGPWTAEVCVVTLLSHDDAIVLL
jgi:hypothetical protein